MELVVFVCLLLILSLNVGVGVGQFTQEPPSHMVALQGDTVLLRCGVASYITATLSWQERDKGQILTKGHHIDPEFTIMRNSRSRISIIGDRSSGEYHLQIREIEGADSGRYACHFYDDARRQDYFSNAVTLTVFTAPETGFPKCSMDPTFARIGVGESVTLTCKSQGGNPPAALTWYKGNEVVKGKINPKGYQNVHNLTVTLTDQDVDQKYTCVAVNPVNRLRPSSCFVKPLRSALGVSLQPSTQTADPGTRAIFNCVSEVVPGLVFTWYFNGRPVDRLHRRFTLKKGKSRLKIYPVIHSDDTAEIKCVASQPDSAYNLTGSATALLWVNVDANPNFVWETTTAVPLPTTTIAPTTTKPATTQPTTPLPTTPLPTTTIHTTSAKTTKPETRAPITKPVTKVDSATSLGRDSNTICRGDTCITVQAETYAANTTSKNNSLNPSNEIEVNLPSDYQNDFVQPNDIPESSKHNNPDNPDTNGSSGLAVGLSLTFIFLGIIIGVGIFLIWKYKFREQPKGKGKGKTKSKVKGKKKPTQILRDNLSKINLTKITSLVKK